MNNIKISDNFYLREFQCRHCGKVKLHSELLRLLQILRDLVKRPIIIHSGFRCSTHNRNVRGVPNSYHLEGMAADIRILGLPIASQRDAARTVFGHGGIGIYNTFTHVDIGRKREFTSRSL